MPLQPDPSLGTLSVLPSGMYNLTYRIFNPFKKEMLSLVSKDPARAVQ